MTILSIKEQQLLLLLLRPDRNLATHEYFPAEGQGNDWKTLESITTEFLFLLSDNTGTL